MLFYVQVQKLLYTSLGEFLATGFVTDSCCVRIIHLPGGREPPVINTKALSSKKLFSSDVFPGYTSGSLYQLKLVCLLLYKNRK